MIDESLKDETCKKHISIFFLDFILWHLCNFPVLVRMLIVQLVYLYFT